MRIHKEGVKDEYVHFIVDNIEDVREAISANDWKMIERVSNECAAHLHAIGVKDYIEVTNEIVGRAISIIEELRDEEEIKRIKESEARLRYSLAKAHTQIEKYRKKISELEKYRRENDCHDEYEEYERWQWDNAVSTAADNSLSNSIRTYGR